MAETNSDFIIEDLRLFQQEARHKLSKFQNEKLEDIINRLSYVYNDLHSKTPGARLKEAPPVVTVQTPPFLQGKEFTEYTHEDWYNAAKWVLFKGMMSEDKKGKDAIEAAGKIISDYRQVVRDDTVVKWNTIKLIEEFLMTKFLSRLHKECVLLGVDIKSTYMAILSELSNEMKVVVVKAWESSDMETLIEKAKRRGKWQKKAEKPEGSIIMLERE